MVSNRPPATITFVFLTVFAAWFVADRYVGVAFYRLKMSEAVELALAFLVVLAFAAVIVASLIRSYRVRAVEWLTVATALSLLAAAEVAWRIIIAPLPMNGFKVAAAVMDLGMPVVALLGLAAATTEWRSLFRRQRGGAATV